RILAAASEPAAGARPPGPTAPAPAPQAVFYVFPTMTRIASKFGGSSVADARQFLKIRDILGRDARRRVIVVSAPGKRHAGEAKPTDLLYQCHHAARKNIPFDEAFALIRDRFLEIERDLKLNAGMAAE